jgi:ZIP family zinc transporter
MPDLVLLVAVAMATILASGLGAIPVVALGDAAARRLQPGLSGMAIGVMGVAAVVGLLVPAVRDGSPLPVAAGMVAGVGGLWAARRALAAHERSLDGPGRRAYLTFGVLFVHSLPEGLAIGSAFAEGGALGGFVILAVAVQNIPEGTATAIALAQAGRSRGRQVAAAILSSAPQLPGAVLAWVAVDAVAGVLPVSFAIAGAAMLALVVADLVPAAWRDGHRGQALAGAVAGALAMGALAVGLAPPA